MIVPDRQKAGMPMAKRFWRMAAMKQFLEGPLVAAGCPLGCTNAVLSYNHQNISFRVAKPELYDADKDVPTFRCHGAV
jgi:hypothetical protein